MRTQELKDWLVAAGATFREWQGREEVVSFGDSEAEMAAAQNHAVIVDRNERVTLSAEGADVVTLIQGLVTGDVHTLKVEGSGFVTTAVDIKGRMVADLRMIHLPDALIMDAEAEPGLALLSHARRHVMMEDARFKDRTATTGRASVVGPESSTILTRAGRWLGSPDELADYHATTGRIGPHEVVIQKVPDFGLPAFEIFCDASAEKDVMQRLLKVHSDVILAGSETLEPLRIQTGYPRWGVELDVKVIPLEADMNYGVSYTKGCYLGQEIIARLDTRGVPAKMLRHIVFSDNYIAPVGEDVMIAETNVGSIRSSASGIAMAYLKRKFNDAGAEVVVAGQTGHIRRLPPWPAEPEP
jgi:folate-binding protein YgfZ